MSRLQIVKILVLAAVCALLVSPATSAQEIVGLGQTMEGSPINTTGFYWGHCSQVARVLSESMTWCYFEDNQAWIKTNDHEAQAMMIACAESGHYCGINVSNYYSGGFFTFDQIRILNY